jgi:hypothetical protein
MKTKNDKILRLMGQVSIFEKKTGHSDKMLRFILGAIFRPQRQNVEVLLCELSRAITISSTLFEGRFFPVGHPLSYLEKGK